jgi:hypothetical protein
MGEEARKEHDKTQKPKDSRVTEKDLLLLVEGILLAFMLQLFYDAVREEYPYTIVQ